MRFVSAGKSVSVITSITTKNVRATNMNVATQNVITKIAIAHQRIIAVVMMANHANVASTKKNQQNQKRVQNNALFIFFCLTIIIM